jgi:hypothetical protein
VRFRGVLGIEKKNGDDIRVTGQHGIQLAQLGAVARFGQVAIKIQANGAGMVLFHNFQQRRQFRIAQRIVVFADVVIVQGHQNNPWIVRPFVRATDDQMIIDPEFRGLKPVQKP